MRGADEGRRLLTRQRGALADAELAAAVREQIRRVFGADLDAQSVVERILADVRDGGDAAVRRYNEAIDGVPPSVPLVVSREEIAAAGEKVDAEVMAALRFAADRIRAFHEAQLRHAAVSFEEGPFGQRVRPLERVGIYVPGTRAVYPSSVLMTAIPARVAGVHELYMATPAAADGSVSPLKLAAADIAGVDGVFRAGGAQGIAALAFGTESIPRVDQVCGPGNIFVTLA